MNLYEILGVDLTATLSEIKKAYRSKCMEYHPDNKGYEQEYHEMMCKINEAYEILSNPEKRRKYDEQLIAELKNKQTETTNNSNELAEKNTTNNLSETEKRNNSDEVEFDYQEYYYSDLNKDEYEEYIEWLEYYIYSYKKRFYNTTNEDYNYHKVLMFFEYIINYEYENYSKKYKQRNNYMRK